ncbi:MAG: cytochrome c1 [Methyloligellaceae bacterium]
MRKTASPKWKLASGLAGALLCAAVLVGAPPRASGGEAQVTSQNWSFSGPFGMFDRSQLQRGYKVYKDVCAGCHGLRLLHFRNLGEPGGPEFSEAQVKALAAEAEVADGPNDEGEMFTRPGKPSDAFVSPFPNENAARAANNGALPPDLSVMAKARAGGPDYIYALMTGYKEAPENMELAEGMSYNTAFPGHQIAMAQPLDDEAVEYSDGTAPTLDNHARDLAAFLMWAAEPKLEERHKIGFRFMIYIILLTLLLYFAKRRIWSDQKH